MINFLNQTECAVGPIGDKLPWPKTFDKILLRNGELSVWAGITGHGKSMLLSHIIVHSLANGHKWCVALWSSR